MASCVTATVHSSGLASPAWTSGTPQMGLPWSHRGRCHSLLRPPLPSPVQSGQADQLQGHAPGSKNGADSEDGLPLAQACPRDGDTDILGLGVRLGVYLSTGALLLSCPPVRSVKEVKAVIASTLPLIISVLAVLSKQAAAGGITDFVLLAGLYVLRVYWTALAAPLSWYVATMFQDKSVMPGFT